MDRANFLTARQDFNAGQPRQPLYVASAYHMPRMLVLRRQIGIENSLEKHQFLRYLRFL